MHVSVLSLVLLAFVLPEPPPPAPVAHWMAPEKAARLRQLLPTIADGPLTSELQDPQLLLYTDAEMPRAYQMFTGALQGIHSPNYNVSANGSEPYGNANREFPWGGPAGMQLVDNLETFRFLHLPKKSDGSQWPIAWWTKDGEARYGWAFPAGTVVGEVLVMKARDGFAYPFEVRIRRRQMDGWAVDAFRPFPTPQSLADRVKELRPQWADQPALAAMVQQLESTDPKLPAQRLSDHERDKRVFHQVALVEDLPEVKDDKLINQLLTTTPFVSVAGQAWRDDHDGFETAAPTTHAGFQIVPAGSLVGFINVSSRSCMRCHETTGHAAREFNAGRDWYGAVRGQDGIFSFHPFDPSCISGNGIGAGVTFRQNLIDAGFVARYDAKLHPAPVYQTVVK